MIQNILLQTSLDSTDFKGEGYIDLTHFRPHVLTQLLLSDTELGLADSQAYLTFNFKTDTFKDLQADVQGSIPHLTMVRGNEKLVIKAKSLMGNLQ